MSGATNTSTPPAAGLLQRREGRGRGWLGDVGRCSIGHAVLRCPARRRHVRAGCSAAAVLLGFGSGRLLVLATATRASRADDAVFAAPLAFCDYGNFHGVACRLRPFRGCDAYRRRGYVAPHPGHAPAAVRGLRPEERARRDAALGRITTRMVQPPVAREGRAAAWRYTIALASPVPGSPATWSRCAPCASAGCGRPCACTRPPGASARRTTPSAV